MSYLILKGSTWHVRMEVPKDVRHVFEGKRNVFKSLKTGSRSEAQKRKWEILSQWQRKIDIARNGAKDYEIESQIRYMNELNNVLEARFKKVVIDYINNVISSKDIFEEYYDAILSSLSYYNDDNIKNEYLKEVKEFKKYFFERDEKVEINFFYELKNLLDKVNKSGHLDEMKYEGFNDEQIEKTINTKIEPVAKSEHPISDSNLKKFHAYQKDKKGLTDKTNDTMISRLKKIRTFLEENNLNLTFENIDKFFDNLNQKLKTKKQYVHAGNSFYSWLIKYDTTYKIIYGEKENPFLKHEFSKEEASERKEFSVDDVTILYKKALEKEKDNLAQAIKIASYTGCRIEEICRFTTSDIVEEKGIKCFFVRKGKTKSSTRMIPVHPTLYNFVDNLCKNADEEGFLIHTTKGNKYNKKSDAVSKAFKRIKDECGYNSDYVFHSFRKTFITQLQQNNVQPLVIMSLAGHLTSTVTFDIYSAGASVEQKLEAIETLKFDI